MKNKTTHTLEQVEALMWKESDILKDPNVGKERKKEAVVRLKRYETLYKYSKDKEINGKAYPVKKQPKDIPKKELLALIEEVDVPKNSENCYVQVLDGGIDPSGAFPPFTKQ